MKGVTNTQWVSALTMFGLSLVILYYELTINLSTLAVITTMIVTMFVDTFMGNGKRAARVARWALTYTAAAVVVTIAVKVVTGESVAAVTFAVLLWLIVRTDVGEPSSTTRVDPRGALPLLATAATFAATVLVANVAVTATVYVAVVSIVAYVAIVGALALLKQLNIKTLAPAAIGGPFLVLVLAYTVSEFMERLATNPTAVIPTALVVGFTIVVMVEVNRDDLG